MDHRPAIADLVHRYALYIRSNTIEKCGDLFTADAVFEHWQGDPLGKAPSVLVKKHEGRDAIVQSLVGGPSADMRIVPTIHNLLISVKGKKAESSAVLVAIIMPVGRQLLGEYADSYRNEGEWRFTSRRFTMIGQF